MAINFEADVEMLSGEKLAAVSRLATQMRIAAAAVVQWEEGLKRAKATLDNIETVLLPAALQEIGMRSLTLTSGVILEVKKEYHVGIKDENEAAAYDWLRQNKAGELIKRAIVTLFGRGDDELAEKTKALLTTALPQGTPIKDTASVHYQTLKAFVKEKILAEEEELAEDPTLVPMFPRELFGVHIVDRAVLKAPKK